eukprot:UN04895
MTVNILKNSIKHTCDTVLGYVYFSVMEPGTIVEPHRGVTNTKLRVHLGLETPVNKKGCYISIEGEKYSWKDGECFIFDDSFVHGVKNETNGRRVILLVDVWHPELNESQCTYLEKRFREQFK